MIPITRQITIDEKEIQFDFVRASGPGGQHVNKVATAVQLRFDVKHSPSLTRPVRDRLIDMAGKKLTSGGILVIEAKRFRTQERNRQDALERLKMMIRKASINPRPRLQTTPSRASKERKIAQKKRRSQIKQWRRPVKPDT
jgi:ribosome-associated protein